ncbi:MAG TPA: hypothetical protein VGR78_11035 [Verrucomicrobiae bacterium]|jgi:hypothetical protein|nr:hypothetical protein [Verrucomicrobiae bacterium]
MNSLKNVLFCLILAVAAAGCASTTGWQAENVPFPRTTPFDSNEFARAAYLDGFERGYRDELSGVQANIEMLNGNYSYAQRQGFYAGAAQARAEKAAVAQNDKQDEGR